jgi:hypothetical protein
MSPPDPPSSADYIRTHTPEMIEKLLHVSV